MGVGRVLGLNVGVAVVGLMLWFLLPSGPGRSLVLFLLLVWSVLAQCLYDTYRNIVSPLPPSVRPTVSRLFLLWAFFSFAVHFLARLLPPSSFLVELGFCCFLSNVWILFLRISFKILRLIVGNRWQKSTEALVILLLLLAFIGAATYEARREYEITRVGIHLGLKKPLSLTLVSDLHLGPVLGEDFCQRVKDSVAALNSDIVILAGDIFDSSLDKIPHMVDSCVGKMPHRFGLYYVTGNHEHIHGDVPHWLSELRANGIRVLDNDCVSLDDYGVQIVGVTDLTAERHQDGYKADPLKALSACSKGKKIVVAHQPNHHRTITEALKHVHGEDEYLLLSGHVHGGQIFPATYLVSLFNDYFAGYYQDGNRQIYVSRGTGQWGPRLRLFARAEMTRIDVR